MEKLTRYLDPLMGFWRWWTEELGALLPKRWRRRPKEHSPIGVHVARDAITIRVMANGAADWQTELPLAEPFAAPRAEIQDQEVLTRHKGAKAHVTLAADFALARDLAYPVAARAEIDKVIDLDLPRLLPLEADLLYRRHEILRIDDDGETLHVGLCAVKRHDADRALRLVQEIGFVPSALHVEKRGADQADAMDFLPDLWRKIDQRKRRMQLGLAASATALAVAVLATGWIRLVDTDERLASELAALQQGAQEAVALRDAYGAAQKQSQFLGSFMASPPTVLLLDELSRRLPDTAWLSEYRQQDHAIRLSGFGNAPAELVIELEASDIFSNVELLTVTGQNDRDGRNRFEMALTVQGEGKS